MCQLCNLGPQVRRQRQPQLPAPSLSSWGLLATAVSPTATAISRQPSAQGNTLT